MNCLPESGYGLSEYEYDDGFDFGDNYSYEDFGIQTTIEPTVVITKDPKSAPSTNGTETITVSNNATPSETKPGRGFMVGGNSPDRILQGLLN